MENVSIRARLSQSRGLIHYNQIMQGNPQDAWVCLNLSLHLQQRGWLQEARRSLHRALSLAPDFSLAHRKSAEICTQLHLREESGRETHSAELIERRAWGRAEARKKAERGIILTALKKVNVSRNAPVELIERP